MNNRVYQSRRRDEKFERRRFQAALDPRTMNIYFRVFARCPSTVTPDRMIYIRPRQRRVYFQTGFGTDGSLEFETVGSNQRRDRIAKRKRTVEDRSVDLDPPTVRQRFLAVAYIN